MKKVLALLAAVGLTGTAGASVVSCGNKDNSNEAGNITAINLYNFLDAPVSESFEGTSTYTVTTPDQTTTFKDTSGNITKIFDAIKDVNGLTLDVDQTKQYAQDKLALVKAMINAQKDFKIEVKDLYTLTADFSDVKVKEVTPEVKEIIDNFSKIKLEVTGDDASSLVFNYKIGDITVDPANPPEVPETDGQKLNKFLNKKVSDLFQGDPQYGVAEWVPAEGEDEAKWGDATLTSIKAYTLKTIFEANKEIESKDITDTNRTEFITFITNTLKNLASKTKGSETFEIKDKVQLTTGDFSAIDRVEDLSGDDTKFLDQIKDGKLEVTFADSAFSFKLNGVTPEE